MTYLKSKISGSLLYCCIAIFLSRGVLSAEFDSSVWSGVGEGAHGDNGSLIIGVNKKTKMYSGYYETNDITGSITAECKFLFTGYMQHNNSVNLHIASAHPDFIQDRSKVIQGKMRLQLNKDKPKLIISPEQVPVSCEWLYQGLPSYRPPESFKFKDGLLHEFVRDGDWIAVGVVRSKRAYFYPKPNAARRGKAFIVAGDLIYIYGEKPSWYWVKFNAGKKETVGWIKKMDTVQIQNTK